MPYSGPMNSTSTDHSDQIENPMCSERTENHRLRLAIFLPVRSQNDGSSGRQSSIQRPRRRPPEAPGGEVSGAVVTFVPPRWSRAGRCPGSVATDGKQVVLRADDPG